jgi:hypothetical protein
MEDALIALPTLCLDVTELLERPSNVLQVADQILDNNEGVTHKATAQSGFYTHQGLDGRTSSDRLEGLNS